ncbi:MAG: 5-(carboxyamino)imidazole ribonucleotide mutase [Deltaproteobacteria bacterium]|nr:5-(carboxyamino)imidazole ribonucleotide mutase [Deltaproteobacteria bacterium]
MSENPKAVPVVGIVMGSKSDLGVMGEAGGLLTSFGVPFEMLIASAHRDPEKVASYAKDAESKGLKIIIAGAGMAAHLAGALAASTTLPVIGVPIQSGPLLGLDALLSTVQMPSAVPVATVAVNGAKNAAYLAIQILSLNDSELRQKFQNFKKQQKAQVESANAELQAERVLGAP